MQGSFENLDEDKEDSYDVVPEVNLTNNNSNEGYSAESRAWDGTMGVHSMLKYRMQYMRGVFSGNEIISTEHSIS
jgi:hypothetical protein